ncbi:NADH-quinone oxidoreductase subunit NuoG [Motiliproteus sp. MSK22-1]|uniref:NADH-quinone oxidoreductase subunit NuoG n=1 Tax=Motiliproteus sp. MSK22-1 TaxID=1897630 RepID=UPI0009778A14|nr:NADH-quinone oxidoreductase subunit NuoG [Motiliproteus sp. MSK22-1]OMH36137.1 hypothetical protein BGP75_10320 [Motiliproteus sp. MSK22-1]
MATITIDGKSYEVGEGQNLLQACLGLGLNLPYFCWHPALGSVGACRQCALIQYQDENDQRGRLVMGCMTPVTDGQLLSINADNAVNFRAGVIEALMTNHPHDCPVCEEGGECHLQDMTVMSGHHSRRYEGLKRTFSNQQLGPFINHEMNRCITCYRCIRYYRDYAGGEDLHAMASRNKTYFGRFEDGTLESEFSGNLVEVCPTGVFTDKPLSKHYSRKWDLQCAPSVCVHCSLGCNISPGERYGVLKRIQNRYNSEVNGYFLCDRGRFGYDFVNHTDRPRAPMIRDTRSQPLETESLPPWREITPAEGIGQLGTLLADERIKWIGIGSPRATLESNLALMHMVGSDHFFSGLNRQEEDLNQLMLKLLRSGHGDVISMAQVEQADAIFILGEDITQSAPRLALSVRQAIRSAGRAKAAAIGIPPWQDQAVQIAGQNNLYPLYLSCSGSTKLDTLAKATYRSYPLEQARLGFAVAQAICDEAPRVTGLTKEQSGLAEQIATALVQAKHPLVISGSGSKCPELIEAVEQILFALSKVKEQVTPWVNLVFSECNSLGLALLNHRGHENCLDDAFSIAAIDHQDSDPTNNQTINSTENTNRAKHPSTQIGVIILENDLYQRASEPSVNAFFNHLDYRVLIDYLPSKTLSRADLVLPSTTFAETQGIIVNNEGRGQSLFPVYPVPDKLRMGWQWLQQADKSADSPLAELDSPEKMLRSCIETEPMLANLKIVLADENMRFAGMKMARMTHRASGRTAMRAQISVHEPKQPKDSASALAYTMEGVPSMVMASATQMAKTRDDQAPGSGLMPFSWFPGWNSNQSNHKFQQEITASASEKSAAKSSSTGIKLALHTHTEYHEDWNSPPKKTRGKADSLQLIAMAKIFGSDELSMKADAVIERSLPPVVSLHPEDARTHNIEPGDLVQINIDGSHIQLPVSICRDQAKRTALIDDSHPALQGLFSDGASIWVSVRSLGPNPVIASDRRGTDV